MVPLPIVVLPSMNVAVPLAVEGESVAVKVTGVPLADGFVEDDTVTAELA
jgi:hypothetical protein